MKRKGIIITILSILFLPICSSGESMTVDEFYRKIKELEHFFPIPAWYETIKIGTYNASTRTFEGKVSITGSPESLADLFPGGRIPPPRMEGDYKVEWIKEGTRVRYRKIYMPLIQTPYAVLQFDVQNGPATITVNGKSHTVNGSALIDVGNESIVRWDIAGWRKGEGRKHKPPAEKYTEYYTGKEEGYLEIRRQIPPIIGLGVFTIPALPISVIYEPPPDRAKTTHARYSKTTYIGTTTEISFGTEKSTTRPVKPDKYNNINEMKNDLNTAANLLSAANLAASKLGRPIPYADKAIFALKFISDGLGKVSAIEEKGVAEAQGTSLTLKFSQTETFDTKPNDGGPGIGDVILYLKNAKFLWLAINGKLSLMMLGYEGNFAKHIGVDFLRRNLANKNATGLDYDVAQALLNLDPFVLKKSPSTLSDRFEYRGMVDLRGSGDEYTYALEKEFSQTDWRSYMEFTTRVEDYRKGWLSFLGIGVREDETVKFTSWNSSISKTIRGEKTSVELIFAGSIDEIYLVDVFFDRVFGTFAFESVPPAQTAMLSGRVIGADGKPISGKIVKAMVGKKSITTVTNKKGFFEFHSPRISGKASLVVDNKIHQEVSVATGKPVSGIILKLIPEGVGGGSGSSDIKRRQLM